MVHEAISLCLDVFNAPSADFRDLDNFDETTDVYGWTAARWQMRGLQPSFGLQALILFALTGT